MGRVRVLPIDMDRGEPAEVQGFFLHGVDIRRSAGRKEQDNDSDSASLLCISCDGG